MAIFNSYISLPKGIIINQGFNAAVPAPSEVIGGPLIPPHCPLVWIWSLGLAGSDDAH